MRKIKKIIATLVITTSIFSIIMIPTKSFAMDEAIIVAAIMKILSWMQDEMMSKLHEYQEEATNKITGKMVDIFKQQTDWERWPASLKSLTTTQMFPYENKLNSISHASAARYISYVQASGSGVDAKKYPVKVINNFNHDFDQVQDMNQFCDIQIPQAVGDVTQSCTPAQTAYTNTMLTGVNPLPKYPDNTLKTAIGQQYAIEVKSNITRTALSHLALDQASNQATNDFIALLQKSFQQPSLEQINEESSEAVARDNLILNQAKAMLELRLYETTLMNQRLLATIVAQNEETHLRYIRDLGQAQSQALHH